jgi:FKBP-type peptidyl-prolyl cis-trans isomerase
LSVISSQKPLGRLICDITRISISWFSTSAIKNQKWWPLQRLEQFEDTKEAIRIRKSKNRQHNGQKRKKNRQHNGQKRKKNRKHNGQKRKVKRTNNDLQNIHIKLKIE